MIAQFLPRLVRGFAFCCTKTDGLSWKKRTYQRLAHRVRLFQCFSVLRVIGVKRNKDRDFSLSFWLFYDKIIVLAKKK